ncbi:MAG TPA: DUF4345 domain-containing protein [Woeseiaceae bacterium]|nr:DUF4345 domain-containing protein [Woeseiaceae bacterium]
MNSRRKAIFDGVTGARLVLAFSGLVAVAIAATILAAPQAFYGSYGIEVVGNATLVNELKAPAGTLLIAGLLMFAGVFRASFAVVSLVTATAVYLSYGLSRVLSIVVDGIPHSGIVSAAGIEIVIGVICLLTLLHFRRAN